MRATLVYDTPDGRRVFRVLRTKKQVLAFRKLDGASPGKLLNIRVWENDDPRNFLARVQKILDDLPQVET